MKKELMMVAVLMMVSGAVFAMGSASKKDKIYADCLVNAPKVCGGSQNVNWSDPVQAEKFKSCTAVEYKKCWDVYSAK